jgi:hypothetical protein
LQHTQGRSSAKKVGQLHQSTQVNQLAFDWQSPLPPLLRLPPALSKKHLVGDLPLALVGQPCFGQLWAGAVGFDWPPLEAGHSPDAASNAARGVTSKGLA